MKIMPAFLFLISLLWFACGQNTTVTEEKKKSEEVKQPEIERTFNNPILPNGADPWVIHKDGIYYYTHTTGRNIELRSTQKIENLSSSDPLIVWQPGGDQSNYKQLWAPEMHFIDGKWYIYFAATFDSGKENSMNENRRMFVLENKSSTPMNKNWTFKGKITDVTDHWAIDGTVLDMGDNKYFIWSGWRTYDHKSNTGIQQLYIAKMINPWSLEGERVMISEPTYTWEKSGLVNEGPVILKNQEGKYFLVYSASGCWTDEYKLGILTLKENAVPLDPDSWIKHENPVFTKNIENSVYAPGHNSFFKSPDGKEDWLLYHANDNSGYGCGEKRSPRIQKFTWTSDGFPFFGQPEALSKHIKVPSSGVQ